MLDRNLERGRFDQSDSVWLRSFSLAPVKVLVVCRGPVRQEAFDVFEQIGVGEWGMLLSEKDSVTYSRCVAPELRRMRFPNNVHRVADYMGVGQEQKLERIREIVEIAKSHRYTHLFAGYGFMAEDAEFIEAIEGSGLGFIGPSSRTARRAGAKDEAKKLARGLGNAVIPGIDDITARTLVERSGGRKGLEKLAKEQDLPFAWDDAKSPEENAEALLQEGYAKSAELVGIPELQAMAAELCSEMWKQYAGHRIRFKHIGGGGGKGQRVVGSVEEIPAAVMDVLAESKVVEPGSNRNFLIELNIERTRHNEIQLVGNGTWCIALGGRDCSLQMHEQKLLEVSLTQELLDSEIAAATTAGHSKTAEILKGDRRTLERMESEGERFGEATGLDSVSTFECVVSGFDHFFMEMNTRIQVEHVVTELVYSLRFANPDDPAETFIVEELIEAMVLLAVHGSRLSRPTRVTRSLSGLEARINATNQALQPHAGGLIRSWSRPIAGEIRFDQGIGTRNPDTGAFIYYRLAGAYDSNVALVLTDGKSRRDNYERMAEVLRQTELRGDDLQTNLPLHYGLVQWFLGKGVMAEPTTGFMQPYLAAVGALAQVTADVDLELAAAKLMKSQPDAHARKVLATKETLLVRPIEKILASPHVFAGFLGRYDGDLWTRADGTVRFAANPIHFLERLYYFLNLEEVPSKPPSEKIWSQDEEILAAALEFYAEVERRTGARSWSELEALFSGKRADKLCGREDGLWQECLAAHRGFQVGLELLLLLPRIGLRTGFLDLTVGEDLAPVFPEIFLDAKKTTELTRALAPPPKASADQIVTPMGGTFYSREAPHLPVLIDEGQHFDPGQPLFVIEVMKMFNKVSVPFSGTITESLMQGKDATVVAKGQPIFRIEPDERIEEESPEKVAKRRREVTLSLLS
ncbi:MAG: biotin carboxylase [Deltaproteobacteria bacterium]|nr:biotin carboxylase [Deltaproteobacteria bacterium]